MARRKHPLGTRQRILDVAGKAFSRKGYRDTTIAEICRLAETNIASVNYHFGNKETLYVEAWREAALRARERHPLDGGVPPDAPPGERFSALVVSLVSHNTDPECSDIEILHMERANPTGLLTDAMREMVGPLIQTLRAILRDLLGEAASETDLDLIEMSILSQCMNPRVFGMRRRDAEDGRLLRRHLPPGVNPAQLADYIVRFSQEGLAGMRRHIAERKEEESPGRAGGRRAARTGHGDRAGQGDHEGAEA